MRILGDWFFVGGGSTKNLRVENLITDPVNPYVGQIWYNLSEGYYMGFDGTTVFPFASGGNTAVIQQEVDRVEAAVGLLANGTLGTPFTTTNYLQSSSTVIAAIVELDSRLNTANGAISSNQTSLNAVQAELDATQMGAGLNSNGTYSSPASSNYLGAATSLKAADILLDIQIKNANNSIVATNAEVANKVNRAGDTMLGNLSLGGFKLLSVGNPTNPNDGVNKAYVDGLVSGLQFQDDIENIQVDGSLNPGENPSIGDRYILTNPADLHWNFGTIVDLTVNDIVQYDGTNFFVAYKTDIASEGIITWDRFSNSFYLYSNDSWAPFGGLSGVTAGDGLGKTGNTVFVNMGAGITLLPSDEVGVDLFSTSGLFLTVDGLASSTASNARLSLLLEGNSLAKSINGLKIANNGIGINEISSSIAGAGLLGGSGAPLTVGQGTGLIVGNDSVSLNSTFLNDEYVRRDGSTLVGFLTLNSDPVNNLHAATKQYSDLNKTALINSFFLYVSPASAMSHQILHNIGFKYCQVIVVDSADKVIIPDAIIFDSANQLTVQFSTSITCKVAISGRYTAP